MVDAETIAAYAAAGWQARPRDRRRARLGRRSRRRRSAGTWSSPTCSCTTSTADGLRRLLAGCARRADALAACEPRRSRFALGARHLDLLPRRQRGDAARRRAQRARRLRRPGARAMPGRPAPAGGDPVEPPSAWQLDEYDDGLFTHVLLRHAGRRPRPMSAPLRRRDRRRRPGRLGGGDPAGARRLVGGAGRAPALPAAQGLRRVHRREQPAAARRARRRRRRSSGSPAPSCAGWP